MTPLRSPVSGRVLTPDTPHSLTCAGERWPVVDGIPYLRIDSEGLVAVALDHLDAGCPDDALVALLTDQDSWWTGPATDLVELKRLVHERDTLTLREAMALLRFGPVADYFAYRWSDPTYLAGLALLEAHWQEPKTTFELACGIGHYLRELTRRGVACTGADVVFAKCWLAKHWVAPEADYVVFDAGGEWPVVDARFDLVMCHDAFYFLPDQDHAAAMLRSIRAANGVLAISHLHNAGFLFGAKGPARHAEEWQALFPDASVYAETELQIAMMERRVQRPIGWPTPDVLVPAGTQLEDGTVLAKAIRSSENIEAWSIAEDARAGGGGRALIGGLIMPVPGAALRPNPLWVDGAVRWPSERYREEYEGSCLWAVPDKDLPYSDPVRLRRVVDLPERW